MKFLLVLFRYKRNLESRKTPGRIRLFFSMSVFIACYGIVGFRLFTLANLPGESPTVYLKESKDSLIILRPEIVDRNGQILATDIRTPSLFANPRQMLDRREAADSLVQLFPSLDRESLWKDLQSDRAFVFIKRELTPAQQARVHSMGIPGLGFVDESRRVYPAGNIASHILGVVSVDQEGLSGIEMYIDKGGVRDSEAVTLSLDLRVQYALREELVGAVEKYQAKAAAGIIFDVRTGEVIAASSLPDFDPNVATEAFRKDSLNRFLSGVFEMGSTFKIFTTAMALDLGVANLTSHYDAREPIRVASFRIDDFHAQHRILSVPEIFIHSSNIGSAKMALDVGVKRHRQFLQRLRLLDRVKVELPGSASPLLPKRWTELSTMTISFGHGLSVTPLHLVGAAAALVNGGHFLHPTFLKRSPEQARLLSEPVLSPETSDLMRYLMRLNVQEGTAKKADVPGYMVGGKTGTAEKIVEGRYDRDKRITNFIGAFPMDAPQFVIWLMLDEPKGLEETHGYATAGWNVAPVAGRIVSRVSPMLSIRPRLNPEEQLQSLSASFR